MIAQLSKHYSCRILTEKDIPSILSLYESNPLYFQHCPPEPNLASVKEDMLRLPEGKAKSDKFYVGFWNNSNLVAVMDFVYAYPDEETVFIGLFMVDQAYQGKGTGGQIVTEALAYFAKNFRKARLAYVKGNLQSQHFWEKQSFKPIGYEVKQALYTIVIVERSLGG
ncbi:Acetyltransferase (GNAT) family protein [Streptococcus constellatus]|uniref:Acetyltransferase (GNAT) family protein n=1 Tax=Streptococcus constellatus TaxID=76860 RepID=A0A564SNS5_STRCV|nr:GNAT family N-acetyltransferase [Streptococcus constellatus]VUW96805.1 Acetyltransferase (GNAT) family protein [Streptococcus constellatus]VUX06629.1 Acetyltransferase (GNAT) family protein [Streptococcus gordonii]